MAAAELAPTPVTRAQVARASAARRDALETERRGVGAWLTTVDHKKIGAMTVATSLVGLTLSALASLLLRLQLSLPDAPPLPASAYNVLLTLHSGLGVYLFALPVGLGFGTYVVPLMLGVSRTAHPRLGALGFWMLAASGLTMLASLLAGGAEANWTAYPPLSTQALQTLGQSVWIVGVLTFALALFLTSLNLLLTAHAGRPRPVPARFEPAFVTAVGVAAGVLLVPTLALAVAMLLLLADRHLGTRLFNPAEGGNALLYQPIFWLFGRPALSLMLLPVLGIVSEIVQVFSRKPLFSRLALQWAYWGLAIVGFVEWARDAFTSGAPSGPQVFLAPVSALAIVPLGLALFSWIATLWGGHLAFRTPLLFAVGAMVMLAVGAFSGLYMAVWPLYQSLRGSYWEVARLHVLVFGSVLFAAFAATYYWFPKMRGRLLDEGLGRWHFWLTLVGALLAFVPLYLLGLLGMQRSLANYPVETGFLPLNVISTLGSSLMGFGLLLFVWNVLGSWNRGRRAGSDPWLGNSLEWLTSSPPPTYNTLDVPSVRSDRPLRDLRLEHVEASDLAHSPATDVNSAPDPRETTVIAPPPP